jgi:hypothetical protein
MSTLPANLPRQREEIQGPGPTRSNEMKTLAFAALCIWMLSACEYELPLTREHTVPLDPAVLGTWEQSTEKRRESGNPRRMVILPFSQTEYLIHDPLGDEGIYYRGYPIEIGGIPCIQLQILGTHEGPPKQEDVTLYHVASYQLTDGRLELRTLNTDLVSGHLKTTEALMEAFLRHKDSKDLFIHSGTFRRMDG